MRKRLVAALWERIGRSQHAPVGNAVTMYDEAVDLFGDYQRSGRLDLLNAAVELFRDAVTATPPEHPDRSAYLSGLGNALRTRFERTGQLVDSDEAVAAGRDAVATTPPRHPNHPACLSNLGAALNARFECTGQLADLDEAVAAGRDAVATTPPEHPDCSAYLSNLGIALWTRFECTGQLVDLDDAIAAGRDAVAATPSEHPDRPACLSNLGAALRTRFECTGQLADLDEAVAAGRDAVAATPPEHPNHPKYMSNLGLALRTRFERTGQLADLDDAVAAARDAVAATPPEHPDRPACLSNFGAALWTRFERTGQLADLDDAIAVERDAVAASPPEHLYRPGYLSNLDNALRTRFERTGRLADLDDAIAAGRDAVATAPSGHPDRPGYLSNFGAALWTRFGRTGQLADLDEAIAAGRDAVATAPSEHLNHPRYLSNLGNALWTRFERTGQLADLDEAIAAGRDAVSAIPFDHPERPRYLVNLGTSLQTRSECISQQADLHEALTAFKDAVGVGSASPADRMRAGLAWGRAAIDVGWVDSAADGFASAVGLLPLLAWHGLPRATREQHLADWGGLAADAAACAIRAGRPERGVELLEAGRSVLWAQTLNLRTDLTDLAQQAPDLATRLDQIRTLLDTPLPAKTTEATAGAGDLIEQRSAAEKRDVEGRMRLAREFDDLLTQIRALDGFEHFLAPTPLTQLRAAATGGPVVIVNTSRYGCHALLIVDTDPAVQVVNLPDLIHDQVISQVNTLLGVLDRAIHPGQPFRDREKDDRHTVFDILSWLWDMISGPVLTSLGHTSPPALDEAWPRIWWCPTGPLTLLPLHAAGHHHRHQRPDKPASTDIVPDRVISSYTPTLTALLRARTASVPAGPPRLLAVGMPTTPGAGDLPAVPAELDRIHARYPITTRLQSPTRHQHHGPPPEPATQPTTSRVLAELPRHAWVHLSCHGSQHVTDSTESAFWLTDGPLRITDLTEQHDAGPRELAFLSACQTATGSPQALDEAIHLAAAMQLLGYRHVIATLWSIYDSPAPDIADSVYTVLTATGAPDANHAADALHHAITALRAEYPTDPLAWAPYLHTGP